MRTEHGSSPARRNLPSSRVQSAVLRIGERVMRAFPSQRAALEAPLGSTPCNAELDTEQSHFRLAYVDGRFGWLWLPEGE